MKNVPVKIYLQVDADGELPTDFNELHGVTWAADRVFDTDIEYTLSAAPTYEQIEAAVKDRSVYNEANDYENATPSEGVGSGIFLSGVLRALSIIRALYGNKEGDK